MIVGLTGGIGSGKTTVGNYFRDLGIPVYIADVEAKKLMNSSKVIKRKLIALFGSSAYHNDQLNRPFIASKIFSDADALAKMNAIVHPRVADHFKRWVKTQDSAYVIKEAAIIFENNLQSQYDVIITVTADTSEKIKRLKKRDGSSLDQIEAVMANQMDDQEKVKLSDFVIVNNKLEELADQVQEIHHKLLEKAGS